MPRKRQHPHAHLLRMYLQSQETVPAAEKWPGVSDPSLAAPDMIKWEYAEFADRQEPGKSKLKWLESAIRQGPLGFDDEIPRHWGMEEFFWHGLPGDDWHPLEAYLAANGERFPPAAQAQLRLWKQARVGFYEVGDVKDNTLGLQEWDPMTGDYAGAPTRAISLSIGGARQYRNMRGQVTLTYVAPWAPDEGLSCAMGYGFTVRKREAAGTAAIIMLGLRQPELICRPYPWKVSAEAEREHLRQWRAREWHGWLNERLVFPFPAFVRMPPKGEHVVRTVNGLLPSTPDQARQFGIYLEVPEGRTEREVTVAGLTGILPADLTSPNWLPIAEYHTYRERAWPPPGTIGQPSFRRLR